MAQRGKDWLAPLVFTGSCTVKTVSVWLEKFLLKELDNPSIIIMDNAPVHNKKIILQCHKKRREGMPIETTVEDLIMSYS